MASSDLKSMAKAALEKNKVFFDEAMEKLADLRFYASRFGGSCDDLLIKQIDLYIAELQQLRGSISGPADNVTRQRVSAPSGMRVLGTDGRLLTGGSIRDMAICSVIKVNDERDTMSKPHKATNPANPPAHRGASL